MDSASANFSWKYPKVEPHVQQRSTTGDPGRKFPEDKQQMNKHDENEYDEETELVADRAVDAL